MKRICFFANSMLKIGGETRIVTMIANELVNSGYDVTIIVKCRERTDYSLYNLSKDIHLIYLNMDYDFRLNNSKFFEKLRVFNRKTGFFKKNPSIIRHFFCSNKLLKKLKDIFRNNKFDVTIGVAGDRSFVLSSIRDLIPGKLIFWNHMNFDAHFKNKGSRYYNEEAFIKPLFKNFDAIVNLNQDDVAKFDVFYGVKSTVIYNCKSFVSSAKSSLSSHKFISCGRLVPQKGFDNLIEIMRLFNAHNKDYSLDIYGSGPLKDHLQSKVDEYKLNDFIKIYPENNNIQDIYPNYDVFLNSSLYEGFGLVTLEALECGLPVIAFDIPANRFLVQDKVTGRIVPSFDNEQYAKTLLYMVENRETLKEYQLNIPQSIEKFDISNVKDEWIKLIES